MTAQESANGQPAAVSGPMSPKGGRGVCRAAGCEPARRRENRREESAIHLNRGNHERGGEAGAFHHLRLHGGFDLSRVRASPAIDPGLLSCTMPRSALRSAGLCTLPCPLWRSEASPHLGAASVARAAAGPLEEPAWPDFVAWPCPLSVRRQPRIGIRTALFGGTRVRHSRSERRNLYYAAAGSPLVAGGPRPSSPGLLERHATAIRFRPFARRSPSTFRPAAVLIRRRNPCVLRRRRLCGWNVRFMLHDLVSVIPCGRRPQPPESSDTQS